MLNLFATFSESVIVIGQTSQTSVKMSKTVQTQVLNIVTTVKNDQTQVLNVVTSVKLW